MKYIKKFNEDIPLHQQVWCRHLNLTDYTINEDDSIDVNENIIISHMGLNKIPIKFGIISGFFICTFNKLTTLENGPKEVGGFYDCSNNDINTLSHNSLEKCEHNFNCSGNNLKLLKGAPKEICGGFNCSHNELTNLTNGPEIVDYDYNCENNMIISIEGYPKELGGSFKCMDNPIYEIYHLFGNYKSYTDSLDYNYLRGKKIIKIRFGEALEEIGKEIPSYITGYKYI